MKYYLFALLTLIVSTAATAHENGMKTQASKYSAQETQTRLEAAVKEKGLTQFAKIDHAEGARSIGLKMPFSSVTLFGSPKGGTPFMVAAPDAAIDFPLKGLVWEDAAGHVFYSYNTLHYIVERHEIKGQDELAKKLDALQAAIAKMVTE